MNFTLKNDVWKSLLLPVVAITSLGYLIDIYDLILFQVTRVEILNDMGIAPADQKLIGLNIIYAQMAGLLLGGFFFGKIGDILGRKASLLGSVLLYSIATLGCIFASTPEALGAMRFLAGLGVAGEVGAGITLISEQLKKEHRNYGLLFFLTLGFTGALLCAIFAYIFPWQTCYWIGGISGLVLLFLRSKIIDGELYQKLSEESSKKRGAFLTILKNPTLLRYFVSLCLITAPITVGHVTVVGLAPELGKAFGVVGDISIPITLMISMVFFMLSDAMQMFLSKALRSRLRAMYLFFMGHAVCTALIIMFPPVTPNGYYVAVAGFYLFSGFWLSMTAAAAEHFGTNIRALATTTIPNIGRGLSIPCGMAFTFLGGLIGMKMGFLVLVLGLICLSVLCLTQLKETFNNDLDFTDD